MPASASSAANSETVRTAMPLTWTITSPRDCLSRSAGRRPARAAEEPGRTRLTTSPFTPSRAVVASPITTMPMPGRGTLRSRISRGTIRLTTSTGTANPIPDEAPVSDSIAVLTPISRPAESSSGPPEFPGLIAASVWMTPRTSRSFAVGRRRFRALMTPVVRVRESPKGLPIAKTDWPTSRSTEVPIGIGRNAARVSLNRTTARS